jgi:hypothetical protein
MTKDFTIQKTIMLAASARNLRVTSVDKRSEGFQLAGTYYKNKTPPNLKQL